MTDERTLAFLHELERADEAVSAVLGELDDLARETEDVRVRALELEAFGVRLPAERARIDAELASAERAVAEAKEALARVEDDLHAAEEARDRERVAGARRAVVRARDSLRMTVRRATEAREERERLDRDADEVEREVGALEQRALDIAAALGKRPQLAEHAGGTPPPGLAGVSEWASRARAALLVVRASLAREREAVIRQANELGALVLGEPLTSLSAALVARRVEQARNG